MIFKYRQFIELFEYPEFRMTTGMWYSGFKNEGVRVIYFGSKYIEMIDNYKDGYIQGELIRYDRKGTIKAHRWLEDNKTITDFLEHPELKKEYHLYQDDDFMKGFLR